MPVRQTHIYAILDILPASYADMRTRLEALDYAHTFHANADGEVIDLHGIAVRALPAPIVPAHMLRCLSFRPVLQADGIRCFTGQTYADKGMVAMDGTMDPDCLSLATVVHLLPLAEVIAGCSGHGVMPFRLWFAMPLGSDLRQFLLMLNECTASGTWQVTVEVPCSCCAPRICLSITAAHARFCDVSRLRDLVTGVMFSNPVLCGRFFDARR